MFTSIGWGGIMARVALWWCNKCHAEWYGPVGNQNGVVIKKCRECRVGAAGAWGRAAKEDWALEIFGEKVVEEKLY